MIFTWFKSGTKAAVLLYALLIAVHTFFALPVYANTVWNPIENGIVPPAVGNWGDTANWSLGLPGLDPPNDPKAVFNVPNAAECQVTDAQTCWNIVMGENGPGGVLRIVDGGNLTTEGDWTSWMSIGYNNSATLIVEEGGVCNFYGHLWWGMHAGADAIIEINGGTITGERNFGLGFWYGPVGDNGVAHVYVNDGLLALNHWNDTQSIHDGSVLDIELGFVTVYDDRTDAVSNYVAAGKITAYGGTGRVLYDYNKSNPGKTTIRGIDVIENSAFELFEYYADPNFSEAFDWEIENYVADVSSLVPKIEYFGEGMGSIDWPNDLESGLPPKDGDRLLMLSTGHIGEPETTNYAKAWQHIAVQEGDRLSGYYFFGTCDYLEPRIFNDYAKITLVRDSDPNIELVYIDVSDVGSHGSMEGWERFEHRFTSDEAGRYDLTFFVTDVKDAKVNSYLGVDGLQLCAAPEYGDINFYCQTDNLDFAILAQFWQINCDGPPGEMSDPNQCDDWTSIGSPGDFDENGMIDVEDLRLFVSGWLTGEELAN